MGEKDSPFAAGAAVAVVCGAIALVYLYMHLKDDNVNGNDTETEKYKKSKSVDDAKCTHGNTSDTVEEKSNTERRPSFTNLLNVNSAQLDEVLSPLLSPETPSKRIPPL